MLTKKDKEEIIKAFNMVDVKKLEVDHPNKNFVKWFRFGSHIGMDLAKEIVMNLPDSKTKRKRIDIKT